MQYVIVKNNKVISTCNFEPCPDDLATRGEVWISCELEVEIGWNYVDNTFVPPTIIPITPTAKELKQQALTKLDNEYQPYFKELAQSIGLTMLTNNQTLIESLRSDYASAKEEYDLAREVIING